MLTLSFMVYAEQRNNIQISIFYEKKYNLLITDSTIAKPHNTVLLYVFLYIIQALPQVVL